MTDWFKTWFNSEYYHLLYKHRNHEEAFAFIEGIVRHLGLEEGDEVLDLACGKGRHSYELHGHGLTVTGIDLSTNSIQAAKEQAPPGLDFLVGDMRDFRLDQKQKAVFNLFTSFGYFDHTSDNEKVLSCIHLSMQKDGFLIIDFMNAEKIRKSLVAEEKISREGVEFDISRHCDGNHFFKNIKVIDGIQQAEFMERVQYLPKSLLIDLTESAGFQVTEVFGSYTLEAFDAETSPRCILVARKNE